jgi:hypothetical protein
MAATTALRAISYRTLTPNYIGKAMDCIASSYKNDPFSNALGLEPKDWCEMASMFVERASLKDFSIVAGKPSLLRFMIIYIYTNLDAIIWGNSK